MAIFAYGKGVSENPFLKAKIVISKQAFQKVYFCFRNGCFGKGFFEMVILEAKI